MHLAIFDIAHAPMTLIALCHSDQRRVAIAKSILLLNETGVRFIGNPPRVNWRSALASRPPWWAFFSKGGRTLFGVVGVQHVSGHGFLAIPHLGVVPKA